LQDDNYYYYDGYETDLPTNIVYEANPSFSGTPLEWEDVPTDTIMAKVKK
jgi:hypothetical protein